MEENKAMLVMSQFKNWGFQIFYKFYVHCLSVFSFSFWTFCYSKTMQELTRLTGTSATVCMAEYNNGSYKKFQI